MQGLLAIFQEIKNFYNAEEDGMVIIFIFKFRSIRCSKNHNLDNLSFKKFHKILRVNRELRFENIILKFNDLEFFFKKTDYCFTMYRPKQ